MTDEELVRQALNGSHSAYADLVVRYTALVLALCRARVHRLEDAEELTQEAFTRGWANLRTLDEPARFGAWLLGIARNLCCCWRRDVRRRLMPFTDVPRGGNGEPDPRLDPPAPADTPCYGFDDLRAEVERLPPRLRETFLLWYAERTTYARLAELLNVCVATIHQRLTRARELLRRRLRRRLGE